MGQNGMPTQEDVNSNIRFGTTIEMQQFEAEKKIEALAKMGGKGYVNGEWHDFSNSGDAAYQLAYNDKMISALLEIQREFGPQYVEQRLKELAVADPEGIKVRQGLWDKIQGELARGTDTTDAQALQDSIYADLGMSGQLTGREARDVNQAALGQQYARGNVYGGAPALKRATALVDASAAKKANAQNKAIQFLVSGVSPDDVAYRDKQQGMANIGAFLRGETPSAQFGQLSGAQTQSAPFQTGGFGVGLNPNAGNQAAQYTQSINNTRNAWSNSQVSPIVSGLGMGMQAAGAAYQYQNSPATNPWYTFDYSNVNPADYE